MGKLTAKGFHCPKCNGWGPNKVYGVGKIQLWFLVNGKHWRYCQDCSNETYAELEIKLAQEGKTIKTRQIDVPPAVVILTDPSDYVDAATLGIEVVSEVSAQDKAQSGIPQK